MTGQIIPLTAHPHRDVQALLPWYVTGQLDAADTARVEAHVDGCEDCRADLARERVLDRELNRQPAGVDAGWAMLRDRLEHEHRPNRTAERAAVAAPRAAPRRIPWTWVGWGLGAQALTAALIVVAVLPGGEPAYRALGTAAAAPAGNLIVIFRPETSEQQLRATLRASAARLVDGPTAANAYVLQVPGDRRDAAAAELRRQPQVVLAEPIDAGARP